MPSWVQKRIATKTAQKCNYRPEDDEEEINKDQLLEDHDHAENKGAIDILQTPTSLETAKSSELEMKERLSRHHLSSSTNFGFEGDEAGDVGKIPFIDAPWFTCVITVTIIINATQMGVETDFPQHKAFYSICEWTFNSIFVLELLCKFFYLRCSYFKQGWNILDFILVSLAVFDGVMWILAAEGGGGTLRSFSAFRMVRILRVLKMVRLLKAFRELWLIIKGIVDSVKTIFWASLLMIILLYICGIFFTKMIGQNTKIGYLRQVDDTDDPVYHEDWDAYEHFGTIPRTMFTLFETSIEPLNLRPVIEKQPYLFPFFFIFIFLTNWGVMNVIIGVIVDNTMEASKSANADLQQQERDKQIKQVKFLRQKIIGTDKDKDGRISAIEMKEALTDETVLEYLDSIGLPMHYTADELFSLFNPKGESSVEGSGIMTQILRTIVHDDKQHLIEVKLLINRTLQELKEEFQTLKDVFNTSRMCGIGQSQISKPGFKSHVQNTVDDDSSVSTSKVTTIGSNGSIPIGAQLAQNYALADLIEAAQLRCAIECPDTRGFRLQLQAVAAMWKEMPDSHYPRSDPLSSGATVHHDAMSRLHDRLKDLPKDDDMMRLSTNMRKQQREKSQQ